MKTSMLLLVLVLCAGLVNAQERRVELKEGAGRAQLEGQCGVCHSLDYVQTNSPFLDRAGWDAEVTKMIKVYGAPIGAEDAKAIVDYLATHYAKR